MKYLRNGVIAGLLISAAAFGYAWGQGNQILSTITGNEQITAQGVNPVTGQLSAVYATMPANMLRATTSYQLTSATSGTVTMNPLTERLIFTAASVSTTVNLPPNPPDGMMVEIINGAAGAFTQCTAATTDGSTLQGAATTGALAAAGSVEWHYTAASKIWYKMR